jgi:hypothetical protein
MGIARPIKCFSRRNLPKIFVNGRGGGGGGGGGLPTTKPQNENDETFLEGDGGDCIFLPSDFLL